MNTARFYTFGQNNSGGRWVYDEGKGITQQVIVEASSSVEAAARAEAIGLYWDGASDDGPDCPCCGDRWYQPFRDDGDDTPTVYGRPASEFAATAMWKESTPKPVCVHYLDGRKEWL